MSHLFGLDILRGMDQLLALWDGKVSVNGGAHERTYMGAGHGQTRARLGTHIWIGA
jgi:hypothetical protein